MWVPYAYTNVSVIYRKPHSSEALARLEQKRIKVNILMIRIDFRCLRSNLPLFLRQLNLEWF